MLAPLPLPLIDLPWWLNLLTTLGHAGQTQPFDGLLADALQEVIFLRT